MPCAVVQVLLAPTPTNTPRASSTQAQRRSTPGRPACDLPTPASCLRTVVAMGAAGEGSIDFVKPAVNTIYIDLIMIGITGARLALKIATFVVVVKTYSTVAHI